MRFTNAAFESIKESIVACDANYTITYWNKISERVYGFKASEAIGKNLFDVIDTVQTLESENSDILEELKTKGYYKGERLYRTGTTELWVNLSIQAIEQDGKRYGWIVLNHGNR